MLSKEGKILNEFCEVGKLEKYRDVLRDIFFKIDNNKCNISTRDDGGSSIHKFPDKDGDCRIRIPLKSFHENPINAIWTILHEFGHHRSGEIEKSSLNDWETRIEREKQAWKIAREEVLLYPILVSKIAEFNKFEEKCLLSYSNEMLQNLISEEEKFQPYLLNDDYTFIGPIDHNLFRLFFQYANNLAPIVSSTRSVHHVFSHEESIRKAIVSLPVGTPLRIFVVTLGKSDVLLPHSNIEGYCKTNNIRYPRFRNE